MRVNLIITGKVQRVYFRLFTQETAKKLKDIKGWVRNKEDGSVQVVAEGPKNKIKQFLTLLKEGSKNSKVENIKITEEEETCEFNDFIIIK